MNFHFRFGSVLAFAECVQCCRQLRKSPWWLLIQFSFLVNVERVLILSICQLTCWHRNTILSVSLSLSGCDLNDNGYFSINNSTRAFSVCGWLGEWVYAKRMPFYTCSMVGIVPSNRYCTLWSKYPMHWTLIIFRGTIYQMLLWMLAVHKITCI